MRRQGRKIWLITWITLNNYNAPDPPSRYSLCLGLSSARDSFTQPILIILCNFPTPPPPSCHYVTYSYLPNLKIWPHCHHLLYSFFYWYTKKPRKKSIYNNTHQTERCVPKTKKWAYNCAFIAFKPN